MVLFFLVVLGSTEDPIQGPLPQDNHIPAHETDRAEDPPGANRAGGLQKTQLVWKSEDKMLTWEGAVIEAHYYLALHLLSTVTVLSQKGKER